MSQPNDDRGRKYRAYDLREDTVPVPQQRSSPLDDVLEERERDLANDIKRARGEQVLAEAEQKAAEARQKAKHAQRGLQVDDGSGVEVMTGFRQVQQQQQPPSTAGNIVSSLIMGGLSPEKAQEFIRGLAPEDIAKLNMFAAGPRQGAADPMMALALLGRLGTQPQVTVKDLIEIGPKYVESAKSMAEMARPSDAGQYAGLLTKMIEEAGKDRQAALQAQIDLIKKDMGGSDPIGQTTTLIKGLRDAGLVPERGSDRPEMDLKIEELRTERELEMMKYRIDMNKWMAEKQAETERWGNIMSTAPGILAMFSKPLEEGIRAAARRSAPQTPAQPGQPPKVQVAEGVHLLCSQCKSTLEVLAPYPETLTCPNCGHSAPFPKGAE